MTRFLTRFESPLKMWRDRKYSISCLVDNIEVELWAVVEGFDIAGSSLGVQESGRIVAPGKIVRVCPGVIYGSLTGVAYLTVHMRSGLIMGESMVQTDTVRIDVLDPCANDFHIWWRNSLGGDAWWNFGFSQDYETVFDDDKKSEQYRLFATGLRIDEFKALDELNSGGDVYEVTYNDLSETNKDKAKVGAQVYHEGATRIGVVVVQDGMQTRTQRRRHDFEVTIQYPDL